MTGIANAHVSRVEREFALRANHAHLDAIDERSSRAHVVGKTGARHLEARPEVQAPELVQLLDKLQGVYLDTGESKGLVPDAHPSVVAAMRGRRQQLEESVAQLDTADLQEPSVLTRSWTKSSYDLGDQFIAFNAACS